MGRRLGYATVQVMRAVADGVGYGLDVMERTGLPSGTVYPTLGRLEKRGYVVGRWENEGQARREGRPRRRYYRLTGAGREALAEAVRGYRELADGGVAVPDGTPAEGR